MTDTTTTTVVPSASDFGDIAPQGQNLATLNEDAATAALSAAAAREIETALILAAKRPRDEAAAVLKIEKACARPSLAGSAIYSFPRGGSRVTGPSVVLARELARCWGNLRWGCDVLPSDPDVIHIRAWAWDLEGNAKVTAEDRFKALIQRKTRRTDADGKRITEWVEPDERDLRELINRRAAFGIRNCLLQMLPADVVDLALARCGETSAKAAKGELTQSREDVLRNLLRAFDNFGVTRAMIEKRLGHGLDEITPEELADLRADYKSIADGNSKPAEHFESATATADTTPTGASVAAQRAQAALDEAAKAGGSSDDEPEDADFTPTGEMFGGPDGAGEVYD